MDDLGCGNSQVDRYRLCGRPSKGQGVEADAGLTNGVVAQSGVGVEEVGVVARQTIEDVIPTVARQAIVESTTHDILEGGVRAEGESEVAVDHLGCRYPQVDRHILRGGRCEGQGVGAGGLTDGVVTLGTV